PSLKSPSPTPRLTIRRLHKIRVPMMAQWLSHCLRGARLRHPTINPRQTRVILSCRLRRTPHRMTQILVAINVRPKALATRLSKRPTRGVSPPGVYVLVHSQRVKQRKRLKHGYVRLATKTALFRPSDQF